MSRTAEKLLEQMRLSNSGWKRRDLDRLYRGYGFLILPGSKHDIIKHPDYPRLRTTLPRHNPVAKDYVKIAIELVDELIRIRIGEEQDG